MITAATVCVPSNQVITDNGYDCATFALAIPFCAPLFIGARIAFNNLESAKFLSS